MVICRDIFFATSISLLVVAGLFIALQSGWRADAARSGYRLLGTASKLFIALMGCGIALALAQDWMGYRLGFLP